MADATQKQRQRLARFYAHYVPAKTAADVDMAVEKFAGNYERMWTSLESKYGKEADIPASVVAPASSAPAGASAGTGAGGVAAGTTKPSSTPVGGSTPVTSTQAIVPVNVAAVRDRLRRYYAHYVPTKTDADIDTAMRMFADPAKGGYEAMFAKLETKYGSEKAIPEAASGALSPAEQAVFDKLTAYYKHFEVARTEADIKTAMTRFRDGANGGYDKMWAKLYEKYGPDPNAAAPATTAPTAAPASPARAAAPAQAAPVVVIVDPEAPRETWQAALEDPASRLRRFYDTHAPTKTDDDITQSLARFAGPDAKASGGLPGMWAKLNEKYGAMPPPPPGYSLQWTRLRKYFNHYPASKKKNAEIDWMLAKACSTPTGVGQLWANLIAQYGVEPLDPEIEKAMRGPTFLTARAIGEPPYVALSTMPRGPDELFRKVAPSRNLAKEMQNGEIVRLLISFSGLDYTMLEDVPLDRRRRIADAMEQQVALNAGMQVRNVLLVDYRGADAEFELSAQAGSEHQLFQSAASVVRKVVQGGFTVKLVRDALMKELRMNSLHVHANMARVVKATNRLVPNRPPVTDPAAVARESANAPPAPTLALTPDEVKAVRIADEVSRMSELQRMQHSWKKTLEERLQGKGGTSLSYKRNNDAFREFMGNIWADTAAAFSGAGAAAASSPKGGDASRTSSPVATANPIPPKSA